jgi:hypothetical protein
MRMLPLTLVGYRPQGVIQGTKGSGGGGAPLPPPEDHGTHIGDWFRQGAGLRVVGNDLDGANVNVLASHHDADPSAEFGGWLVMQAAVRRGITLDFRDPGPGHSYRGGLNLKYPGAAHGFTKLPLRILLVGFNIVGLIEPEWIDLLWFYDCVDSNEPHEWDAQYKTAYQAAHGSIPVVGHTNFDDSLPGFGNWTPSCIRMGNCGSSADHGLKWFFSDFVDVGDDVIFDASGSDIELVGCRVDNNWHHEINYYNAALGQAAFHSDWGQCMGGSRWKVRRSSLKGHFQSQVNGGSITLDFDQWWSYGSDGVGFSFDETTSGSHIVGNMRHGKWFAHGQNGGDYQSAPRYDPNFDELAYGQDPTQGGTGFTGPAGLHWHRDTDDAVISMPTFAATYHQRPSGITVIGGILSPDTTAYPSSPWPRTPHVYDHVDNPAVIDRLVAGHGPNDWAAYIEDEGPGWL